jgi:hypothetical protein
VLVLGFECERERVWGGGGGMRDNCDSSVGVVTVGKGMIRGDCLGEYPSVLGPLTLVFNLGKSEDSMRDRSSTERDHGFFEEERMSDGDAGEPGIS